MNYNDNVKKKLKDKDFSCEDSKMIKDGKTEPCKCYTKYKRQRNNLRFWMTLGDR